MFSSVKKYRIRSAVIGLLGSVACSAAVFDLVYADVSLRAEIGRRYEQTAVYAEIISGELHPLININTASARELRQLDGIGEAKARAVVEYRDLHGEFKSVDDLLKVSGIGEKILENIRGRITV